MAALSISLVKALEKVDADIFGDAFTIILDIQNRHMVILTQVNINVWAARRVLDSVGHQVVDNLREAGSVSCHRQ